MKIKLLAAMCNGEILHFDIDGRIYELNPLTNSYIDTERFIHLDYYGAAMTMLPPEYLRIGNDYPIENDVTYEVFDE